MHPDPTATPEAFVQQIRVITSRIRARPLDATLEQDLNAWFPPASPEFEGTVTLTAKST